MTDQTLCLTPLATQHDADKEYDILRSDVEAAFTSAGVTFSLDQIHSIKLAQFSIIVDAATPNFDGIIGVSAFLRESGATGDGTQVCYSKPIGTAAQEITFSMNGEELASMFKANDHLILKVRFFNSTGGNPAVCAKITGAKFDIKVGQ